MSKVKSPQDKKALSLKRDRRNTYGENPEASRKGIRRGKQRSHMGERRAVGQILSHLRQSAEEGDATDADVLAKTIVAEKRQKAFKKMPDSPLGVVIKAKLARRAKQSQLRAVDAPRAYASLQNEEIFDMPYNATLHKRFILRELRRRVGIPRWGRHKKKSRRISWHERDAAVRWREAILRDAPPPQGILRRRTQMAGKNPALV